MEDQMKSLQEEINFSLEAILWALSGNSFSYATPKGQVLDCCLIGKRWE